MVKYIFSPYKYSYNILKLRKKFKILNNKHELT